MAKTNKSRLALEAAHEAIRAALDESESPTSPNRPDVWQGVTDAYAAVRKVLGPPNNRIDEVAIVGSALWACLEGFDASETHPNSVAGAWFEAFYRATERARQNVE